MFYIYFQRLYKPYYCYKKIYIIVRKILHKLVPVQSYKNLSRKEDLMDHKYATRSNYISVKLPKVKLEAGRKGFYFLGAKVFNALPPEVKTIKFKTVFRKALDEHFN